MKQILILGVFLMTFLCYSNAKAQIDAGITNQKSMKQSITQHGFGIGSKAGFFAGDNADTPAWLIGLLGRYRVGSVLGLEASVNYIWMYHIPIKNMDEKAVLRSIPVNASFLIHLPLSKYIIPYGIAGVGMYITFQDFDDQSEFKDKTSTSYEFHLGAGLEVPVSQNVSLYGDWRHIFLEDANELDEQMLSDNVFNFGVIYYFR
jgi:opacity protein-like surface antigen